jgi:hypothetical protein
MSVLSSNSRGLPEFDPNVKYNATNAAVGLASIAFKVADSSLEPPQAIAILSAAISGSVDDEFGIGDGKFTKVDSIDDLYINIDGTSYSLITNRVFKNGNWEDANILMYKTSASEYVLQFDGKLIHITNSANKNAADNYLNDNAFTVYDSQTDIDSFQAFALRMGIDKHTVLGAKIILKTLMAAMGYDVNKLDETFMNPQADYLAFINQTLSPLIEAGLTATMAGLKSAIDFFKKIVQKASS